MNESLDELMRHFALAGRVVWLGIRPEKWQTMQVVSAISVNPELGIEGDHYSARSGNRQVTLIQAEHLQVVAQMMGVTELIPDRVRRNIVISEINLLALKNKRFKVGDVYMEFTGLCHPCSRMEQILGTGGYNAMRGHGGITARVLSPGVIHISDMLSVVE